MNICNATSLDNSFVPLPQRLVDTLGRLQIQAPHSISGSVYIYDLVEQRTLCASCSVAAMLGYSADAVNEMEPTGLASLIHPDDLDLVSEHYQRFNTLHPHEVVLIEYRMRQANGAWCWLRSQETPLITAIDGFPLQILGIVQMMPQPSPSLESLPYQMNFAQQRKLHYRFR